MANKSFTVIKGNVGSEVGDTSATFATIIGKLANRRYFQILRSINWQNINDAYTFDTVSGTQRYVLPDDFRKEINCSDTTNDMELTRMELAKLREEYTDISDTGTVERYCIIDDVVKEQPSSSSYLAIKSSSASDTTQSVLIRGLASSAEYYETVTLTGTTNATSANPYTRIKGISKSAATAGSVTVIANAGVTTQAFIPPETLETRYKLALLHYIPTAVYTIAMPYIVNPMPLSQDYDYPVVDIGDLIEIGTLADAWRAKRQFSKAQTMEVLFNLQLQEYIFDKENQPNMIQQFFPTTFNRDDTV